MDVLNERNRRLLGGVVVTFLIGGLAWIISGNVSDTAEKDAVKFSSESSGGEDWIIHDEAPEAPGATAAPESQRRPEEQPTADGPRSTSLADRLQDIEELNAFDLRTRRDVSTQTGVVARAVLESQDNRLTVIEQELGEPIPIQVLSGGEGAKYEKLDSGSELILIGDEDRHFAQAIVVSNSGMLTNFVSEGTSAGASPSLDGRAIEGVARAFDARQ